MGHTFEEMEKEIGLDTADVAITLSSELEPVETKGVYRKLDGGFSLRFDIDDSKYHVTLVNGKATLSVEGLLSYTLDFSAPGEVEVKTVFGSIKYDFEPVTCEPSIGTDINLFLSYKLTSPETGEITRKVVIAARAL